MLLCLALVIGFIPTFTTPARAAEGTWTLVTDASTLAAGDQIIIASTYKAVALSTTQNKNNRGTASITKSGDTATISSSVEVITLETGTVSGTFGFKVSAGYLYAASSSNNYLKTQTTNNANGSWKIEIATSGVATIKAQGSYSRNLMQYNNSNTLFAAYSGTQKNGNICLYKFIEAGSTEPEVPDCGDGNHQFGDWETTKEATLFAVGEQKQTRNADKSHTPKDMDRIAA